MAKWSKYWTVDQKSLVRIPPVASLVMCFLCPSWETSLRLKALEVKIKHLTLPFSLLVNIYGSREMFVNEYRNLLADRLLQSLNYDISREVCVAEVAPPIPRPCTAAS